MPGKEIGVVYDFLGREANRGRVLFAEITFASAAQKHEERRKYAGKEQKEGRERGRRKDSK